MLQVLLMERDCDVAITTKVILLHQQCTVQNVFYS